MKSTYSLLKIILVFFVSTLTFYDLSAQYYIIGQDPAAIKWKQINSRNFKIIYPDGYRKKAEEYVNLLELSRPAIVFPNNRQYKKTQIVLHNETVVSNAVVSPTPMHADFFEMPDQDTYAQTWAKQLTLHEYRHIAQMQNIDKGFTNTLTILFGEQAIGGVMGVFMPFWFIEGDAVYSETIFSKSGRGRSPDFTMDLKAQVIDKKIYPYDKAQFGSYKNYVPDYYTLGYELVINGYYKYGNRLWHNSLNNIAKKPYTLVPFTKTIKEITGTGKVGYYKNTMESQKKIWLKIDSTKTDTPIITLETTKHYSDYRFVKPLLNGSLIFEKSSIDDINRFIIAHKDGSEKNIHTPGYNFKESLSANDSLICWNEKTYDPRWTNRDYSVIKIYNYRSKKLKQLTHRSRLFSPSLANSGSKLVAVHVSEKNNYSLQILSTSTGSILKEIKTPDNLFFMHPDWSNDDRYIVATVLGENGKSIMIIDPVTGDTELILPFGYTDISRPDMFNNKVVYSGSYDGTSNLYVIDIESKETYKLTDVRFGATDPVFTNDGSTIYFSLYTSNGYRISSISSKTDSKKVELSELKTDYLVDRINPAKNFILDDSIIPEITYSEEKYSRGRNLFNLHSWGLAAVDLNNYEFQPGVSILTQNILSTAYGTIGYYWDPNENAGKTKLHFEYAGWYPVINLEADYGLRRTNYLDSNNIINELKWMETNLKLEFSLPLNLTRGVWYVGITPFTGGTLKFLNETGDYKVEFTEDQVTSLTYGISARTQYKRSRRDIFPKWGLRTNIIFRHTPFSSSESSIFGCDASLYLPGIVKHHGIRIYSGYQNKKTGNYSYSNTISTPRGYSGINLADMVSIKSDYAFPIVYPDLNLPAIAYLKRITAHVFYDYITGENRHGNLQDLSSAGMELYTDWHFLSLIPNIRLGLRSNYRISDESVNFEFLYGFSIN